jgi:hypothetical protein
LRFSLTWNRFSRTRFSRAFILDTPETLNACLRRPRGRFHPSVPRPARLENKILIPRRRGNHSFTRIVNHSGQGLRPGKDDLARLTRQNDSR